MDVSAAKRAMRSEMLARRNALTAAQREAGSAAIADRFLDLLHGLSARPRCVSAFWPLDGEVDLRPLMHTLTAQGIVVGLPAVRGKDSALVFRRWQPGDPLVAAGFGLSEPAAGAPEVTPDVLAVPLLAFDSSGRRLGYGGGHFDRTLHLLRAAGGVLAVGVAYDRQEAAEVPMNDLDERLDVVVTDRRTIRCIPAV